MILRLQKVDPDFLEPEKKARSAVWLRDVQLNPGEHCHIVAPSGSGKTSLVQFLYHLRSDYHGTIYFGQEELKKTDARTLSSIRAEKMSVVFQDLRLFPEHTVRQNLMIKWVLAPFHTEQQVYDMAERLGVSSKLDKTAGTCSYGEQQRVAIIRALLQPFDLLILDEPFSHLDDRNRDIALDLILEEAKKRNAALLLADLEVNHSYKADQILYL